MPYRTEPRKDSDSDKEGSHDSRLRTLLVIRKSTHNNLSLSFMVAHHILVMR